MNQNEEIARVSEEIEILSKELANAKQSFEKDYSSKKLSIAKYKEEIDILYQQLDNLHEKFVSPVSSNPRKFVQNYSFLYSDDISNKLQEMGMHDDQGFVSYITNELFTNLPFIKAIHSHINAIWKLIGMLETDDYIARKEEICNIERFLKNKKELLKIISDIGKFRAYAKTIKDKEGQEKENVQRNEKLEIFKKWFVQTYEQKLIDSFNQAIDDMKKNIDISD
jgi:hypothetical protein